MVKKAISMGCKKHRVDALFLAADCEDELKEYDASVAYYNKVVLATTDPEIKRKAYDLKGDSYTGRQQYQPALTSYQKAAQQNPREARPIYSKMADCYSALGNVEKAEYYKRLSYH
jgi:tetratricopeptide (TPR) repeat protein